MTPPIQEPVTGQEAIADTSQPLAALSDFYRALNGRDMGAMEQNWSLDNAVMHNPLGGIRRGWLEIKADYHRLFTGGNEYFFEFFDYTLHEYGDIFFAVGRERGELVSANNERLELAIRTTRVFARVDDRWRQAHHHGSIEDPAMLESYQRAIMGEPVPDGEAAKY